VSESALVAHDLARGVRLIAGVDEVGRAPWAGPIMAAGVLFDFERLASGEGREVLEELKDCKRLGRAKRERLADAVLAHADAVSLVSVPAAASIVAKVACDRLMARLGESYEGYGFERHCGTERRSTERRSSGSGRAPCTGSASSRFGKANRIRIAPWTGSSPGGTSRSTSRSRCSVA
jgi:ribonuclease HII